MKKIAALCIVITYFTSCSDGAHHKGQAVSAAYDRVAPAPMVKADKEEPPAKKTTSDAVAFADVKMAPPQVQQVSTDTSKKITKEGEIRFETADVALTRKRIIQNVQKLGGYVSEDNQSKNEGSNSKEYNLKVRVPAKNFDKLLDTVADAADQIDSKNINIKDVTTEYIDTKTRLDNKKKLEDRYLQLLNKANKMSDMLQIEGKLEEIRSDIESTQGQLNYMAKQVAYSSLDITFYSLSVAPKNETSIGFRFKQALSDGWDCLQTLFFGSIAVWPVLIILFLVFIWLRKRIKNRRVAPESA
ncbi:hypothetical protein BEL04_21010 [Mucilaginibacter sp. PPCGB 2223]|uniref:DUF4349 domain-containing protein n=1 Tax=Mucilaginibacter sp. PPCGB 2223 TaxID=1886027 RepID=UPI000826B2BE|nr:DUF4349 domain-containing protein [Mucilaginibacter sp. PPCGB 2223]OCX51188.1 hypothetical protein BEL04_21010 [Mucilaginibacter sp. PPCGB 2223]